MAEKFCPTCRRSLDVARFSKDASRKDGLRGRCKDCDKASSEAYRADPAVRERINECGKAWAKANRDRHRENARRFHEANPDKSAEYQARWYHEGDGKATKAAYRAANRRKFSGFNMDRRAAQYLNHFERIDYAAVIERDEATCYLCGAALDDDAITLDHVVPLSRGGAHDAGNLRVCCRPCNSRKNDRLLCELTWFALPE